jgi:predicted nucleic acid-binding protein
LDTGLLGQIETRTAAIFDAFGERILPVTLPTAELWGQLLARKEKHVEDAGLAATAKVHGLVVVTRNINDFSGRGVPTLDPFEPKPRIRRS